MQLICDLRLCQPRLMSERGQGICGGCEKIGSEIFYRKFLAALFITQLLNEVITHCSSNLDLLIVFHGRFSSLARPKAVARVIGRASYPPAVCLLLS